MHSVFGPEVCVPHNYTRPVCNLRHIQLILLKGFPKLKTLDHKVPMAHDEYVACVAISSNMLHANKVYIA